MLDNAGIACLTNAILRVDRVLEKLNHELRTLCINLCINNFNFFSYIVNTSIPDSRQIKIQIP